MPQLIIPSTPSSSHQRMYNRLSIDILWSFSDKYNYMRIKDHIMAWQMPAAYLKVFLQLAATESRSAEQLLTGTGLSLEGLLKSDLSVSFEQTRRVVANAAHVFGPAWHLSLTQGLSISSHGPLGFATVTAPDLRASVDVLLRFIGIRAPFVWLAGTLENDNFVIRLYETIDMGEERTALVELVLIALQGLLERPLGREIRGARVTFANSAPVYRSELEQTFHSDLSFNASGHTLSFPAAWLDEPCVLFDEAMHRYLVARCEEELRVASGVLPAEIAVRQALLARPDEFPGLSEIAATQHVSSRTLIRRLKDGDTSYHAILEDVRKTMAVDYLFHSDMNVNSIAYRLGYHDPSNFGRAFRSWFGVSPGRYRSTAIDPSK